MNFIPKIEYIEKGTGLPKTVAFTTPPEGDPFKESYKSSTVTSRSNNGTIQTQFNYNTKLYSVEFVFQPESVKLAIEDFILNHASRGATFNYFPSNDEVDFETFKYTDKAFKFKRPIPDGAGDFLYSFKFKMERQA